MTAESFYKVIAKLKPGSPIGLNGLEFECSEADVLAAKIVLYLLAEHPTVTQGEVIDALQAAVFWETFWAGLLTGQEGRSKS